MKNKVRKFVKQYLPFLASLGRSYYFRKRSVKGYLNLLNACFYDFKRYWKFSATKGFKSEKHLLSKIIMEYHALEKGLTMPNIRYGFAKNRISPMIKLCNEYSLKYSVSHPQFKNAIGVLIEYLKVHEKNNIKLDEEIIEGIKDLQNLYPDIKSTHQIEKNKHNYFGQSSSNFVDFSNSRHSLRHYSNENIDIELIKKAIDLTKNTPSVCNRQAVYCYVFTEKEQIAEILKVQGGNRGFGHLTNKLIVVTSDLNVLWGEGERYQAFIDGGLVAMNLLYSLHYHKIGACILNCSNSVNKDKRMRKVTNIDDSHSFIAMISCGYLPDDFKIAASKKNNINYRLKIDGKNV